jgi:hypothetical protein
VENLSPTLERGFEFSPFQLTNFFLFPLLVGGGRGRWEAGAKVRSWGVRFRVGFST